MPQESVASLFNGVLLKVLLVLLAFAVAQVGGLLAARRLTEDRQNRRLLAQGLSAALFLVLLYVLVISRFRIV